MLPGAVLQVVLCALITAALLSKASHSATPNGLGLSDPRQSAAAGIVSNNRDDENDLEHVGSFLAHGFVGITPQQNSNNHHRQADAASSKVNAETRLINKWLTERAANGPQSYIGRPRMNHTETVNVGLGFGIYRLGEVDETLQTVSIHGWTIMKWRDDSIVWKPSDYDQLSYVSLPQHLVWKPDVALFNGASRENIVNIFGETNVIVSSRGNITWVPPTTVRVPFESDFSSWPHDHHRLQLQLGAWSHDASQISIMPINNAMNQSLVADRTSYVENDKWRLVSFTARRYVQYYECCPDMPWPSMIFELEFERRPNFISHVIDWPLQILIAASCLVFTIALESPLRLVYCMLQLVCHVFFLNLLLHIIPASAVYGTTMPIPLRHITSALTIVFIQMVIVALIQKLSCTSCAFPMFLEKMLSKVGWLLGVSPLSQFTHLRYVDSNSTGSSGIPAETVSAMTSASYVPMNSSTAPTTSSNGIGTLPRSPVRSTLLLQDNDFVADDETAATHPYGPQSLDLDQRRRGDVNEAASTLASRRSVVSSGNVMLNVDERHRNNRQWRLLANFLNRVAFLFSGVVIAIILL